MNFRPPEVWIVSGPNRPARNALARRLAEGLGRAAHVDGEALWDGLVEGRADPLVDEAEADRQFELSIRNQCLLARSYAEAGFTPVLDFPVSTTYYLEAYQNYLLGARLRFVIIEPPEALAGTGLSVRSADSAESIIERSEEASVRRV